MRSKHIKGITAASLAAGLLAAPLANAAPSTAPSNGDLHTFDPDAAPGVTVDTAGPAQVERYRSTAVRLTDSGLPGSPLNGAPGLDTSNWPVMFFDTNNNDAVDAGETGIEMLAWILNRTEAASLGPGASVDWTIGGDEYDSNIWIAFDLQVKALGNAAGGTDPFGLSWQYTDGSISMFVDNDGTGNGLDKDVLLATFDVTGETGQIDPASNATNLSIFGDKTFMESGVFMDGAVDLATLDRVFGFTLHDAKLVTSSDFSGLDCGAAVDAMAGEPACMLRLNTNSSDGDGFGSPNTNQELLITVPEPATLGLLGLGFMGLGAASRRRRRQA